jgi:hypothetical protein
VSVRSGGDRPERSLKCQSLWNSGSVRSERCVWLACAINTIRLFSEVAVTHSMRPRGSPFIKFGARRFDCLRSCDILGGRRE